MSEASAGGTADLGKPSDAPARTPYHPDDLARVDLDTLIEILVLEEDRAPRSVIDECARRGGAMIDRLAMLLAPSRSWGGESSDGEWWLPLHAVMILGLIVDERAGRSLVSFMRRIERASDEDLEDWLGGYWPAFFRNKPETVVPALRTLAHDRAVDGFMRIQAVESIVALSEWSDARALDAELDWTAGIAADKKEDWTLRMSAADILIDYPRQRHRALLDELVALQNPKERHFSADEVIAAYEKGVDSPQWQRFDNPWGFYDPEALAEREKRRARAAEERLDADDDDALNEPSPPYVRSTPKVGRNDPCPCGSGKKYKKCCLEKANG